MENEAKKHVSCYLNDDLIFEEILTILPTKSIVRFKSVSKQWRSTLSSSKFAMAHLMKSPFSRPRAPIHSLFIKCGSAFRLLSLDGVLDDGDHFHCCNFVDKLVEVGVEVDFCVGDGIRFRLTGCCNGLICLTPDSYEYFILWNPATRKMHKYDSDGFLKSIRGSYCSTYGFGYASSVDDYKYVRVVMMGRHEGNFPPPVIIHVFSLRENRWRRIDFDMHLAFGEVVLSNEKLYWVGYSPSTGCVMVCFDLGVEKFDIFPYQHDFILGTMGECLCKYKCEILNDKLELIEPPTTLGSITLPKDLISNRFFEMVGFTRNRKFFVSGNLLRDDGVVNSKLWMVNTGTKPVKYSMLHEFDEVIKITRYVPSLVSPFPFGELSEA